LVSVVSKIESSSSFVGEVIPSTTALNELLVANLRTTIPEPPSEVPFCTAFVLFPAPAPPPVFGVPPILC
jgi:hypothetical protein